MKASRILVVAGEARRKSRATVRALGASGRPRVELHGRRMLYVITLRPLFFRSSTPEQRLETVVHELYHLSAKFDGSLERSRKHSVLGLRAYRREIRPLVRRYLEQCPPELYAMLSYDGEVAVRQWLERPTRGSDRTYTETSFFLGPVRMKTARLRPADLN